MRTAHFGKPILTLLAMSLRVNGVVLAAPDIELHAAGRNQTCVAPDSGQLAHLMTRRATSLHRDKTGRQTDKNACNFTRGNLRVTALPSSLAKA
jgi:hypothetical protein